MIDKKLTYEEINFLKKHNRLVKVEDAQGYSIVTKMYRKKLLGFSIHLCDNSTIKCSIIHNFLINNKWISAEEVKVGDFLTNKYGNPSKEIIKIDKEPEQEWLDFEIDNEFESYIQNEVIHHNSGKSVIAYIFLMYMYKQNFNSLLVVPSTNLVDQMFSDFEEYGLKNAKDIIKQIGGDHKGTKDLSEKKIIISTWQSLQNMDKKQFNIFDCLVIDESHGAKADSLTNIVQNAVNSKWKIGMTGTIPRIRVDKLQLLGTLGKVHNVITPGELIERGLATPIVINALYLNYSNSDRDMYNSNKPDYNKEKDFIAEHYYRNLKVSKTLIKLAETGNTIGLFSNISHGEKLLRNCIELRTGITNIDILYKLTPKPIKEAIEKYKNDNSLLFYMNSPIGDIEHKKILRTADKILDKEEALKFCKNIKSLDDINIFFMTGAVSPTDREHIRKNLETVDATKDKKGAIILGSWQIVSTGINFKRLHSIVYCSSLKSFFKVVQSIGRGMRLYPGKKVVNIYDFVDILSSTNKSEKPNYVLKHFYERLEYYNDDGYSINEKELFLEGDTKSYEKENAFSDF